GRPAGVPPPIRLRPGYGLWTALATATCAFLFIFVWVLFPISAPTGIVMAGLTWWIRRHTGSLLAVLADLLGVVVLVILWRIIAPGLLTSCAFTLEKWGNF